MFKVEYIKILDWLEDFISSGQANEELGNYWKEEDLIYYLKKYSEISEKDWLPFYTLLFKKQKYIIEDNVLIEPCLKDIKKADDIPNTVNSIKRSAFNWCTSLTNITILNSVTEIGDGAFYNCSSLKTINFNGTTEEWEKITKNETRLNIKNIHCSDGDLNLLE